MLSILQSSHNTRSVAPRISNHYTHVRARARARTHTHNIYSLCDLEIVCCVMFRDSRHHAQAQAQAQAHLAHLRTAPFVWPRAEKKTVGICWILLVGVGCGGCRAPSHLFRPHLAFQPNRGCGDLGFFQLTRSNSSPGEVSNPGGCISAHTRQESGCSVTPSQFQFFGPKSGGMSLLLGRAVPHKFILRFSESSESLGQEQTTVHKHFASYTFSSAET